MSIANLFSDDGNVVPMETHTWNALGLSEGFQPNTVVLSNETGYLGSINSKSTTLNAPEVLFNSNSVKIVPDADNANVFQVVDQNGGNILNASYPSVNISKNLTVSNGDVDVMDISPAGQALFNVKEALGFQINDQSQNPLFIVIPAIEDAPVGAIIQTSTMIIPLANSIMSYHPFAVYDLLNEVIMDVDSESLQIRYAYNMIPNFNNYLSLGSPDQKWAMTYTNGIQTGITNASVLGTDANGNIIKMSTLEDINLMKQQIESLTNQVNAMAQKLTEMDKTILI